MNTEKIKVVEGYYECRMCPMTIVGKTEDGETIYARFRWGRLSVRIDPRDPAPHGGAAGIWVVNEQIGDDEYAGWISYETLREVTKDQVEWPDDLDELPPSEDDDDPLNLLMP